MGLRYKHRTASRNAFLRNLPHIEAQCIKVFGATDTEEHAIRTLFQQANIIVELSFDTTACQALSLGELDAILGEQ
jgi:hypothetical protein